MGRAATSRHGHHRHCRLRWGDGEQRRLRSEQLVYDLRDHLPDNGRVQEAAAGHAFSSAGDVTELRRLCARILELGDRAFAGAAWQHLGVTAFNEGDYEQAIEYQLRTYESVEAAPDDLFDHVLNPAVTAMILGATGRDVTEFINQALERANARDWPTGIAFANCAAGLDLGGTDPAAALAYLDRAIDVAAGVDSRSIETMARNFKINVMSRNLPLGELAIALNDLLRRLQHLGDTNTTLLALSQAVVLFDKAGRYDAGAVATGWLDGRSGRNVQTVADHNAAVTSIRQSVADQWDHLVAKGHSMTRNQTVDFVCGELLTIR